MKAFDFLDALPVDAPWVLQEHVNSAFTVNPHVQGWCRLGKLALACDSMGTAFLGQVWIRSRFEVLLSQASVNFDRIVDHAT